MNLLAPSIGLESGPNQGKRKLSAASQSSRERSLHSRRFSRTCSLAWQFHQRRWIFVTQVTVLAVTFWICSYAGDLDVQRAFHWGFSSLPSLSDNSSELGDLNIHLLGPAAEVGHNRDQRPPSSNEHISEDGSSLSGLSGDTSEAKRSEASWKSEKKQAVLRTARAAGGSGNSGGSRGAMGTAGETATGISASETSEIGSSQPATARKFEAAPKETHEGSSRHGERNLPKEQPLSTASTKPRDGSGGICFAALGDFGLEGEAQSLVAQEVDNIAARFPVQFYLGLGDNFYPSGSKRVGDPRWSSMIESVFGSKKQIGRVPCYAVLGNHDYLGDAWSQIARSYSRHAGNWTMPNFFYYVLHNYQNVPPRIDTSSMREGSLVKDWGPLVPLPRDGGVVKGENVTMVVLMLDTVIQSLASGESMFVSHLLATEREEIEWIHERQMQFVEDVLAAAAASADWIIIVGHYPIYSDGQHGDTPVLKQYLEPLIKKYKVDAYLSGHDHILSLFRDGSTETRYVVSGSASKTHDGGTAIRSGTEYFGAVNGFTFHLLTKDEMTHFFIDKDGVVTHVDAMLRQDRSEFSSSGNSRGFPELRLSYWQPVSGAWTSNAFTSMFFWIGLVIGIFVAALAREAIAVALRYYFRRKVTRYRSVIEMPGRDFP